MKREFPASVHWNTQCAFELTRLMNEGQKEFDINSIKSDASASNKPSVSCYYAWNTFKYTLKKKKDI